MADAAPAIPATPSSAPPPPSAASPPPGGNGAAAPADGTSVPAVPSADWRAGLEGEHKEFASKIASPADLVKVAWDLRKQNSAMLKVPDDKAQPEEVQKFRKAIGVPDKVEDYEFDLGREPTEADKGIQAEVAKIALETGVPKPAMKALSKAVTELARAQSQEADRVALKSREDAQAALKREMGTDYDGNLVIAKRALDKFGGPDLVKVIETATLNGAKLGDHPAVIKAFIQIGRRMGEGDYIGQIGTAERTVTQERINAIMVANPPGTEKYKDPAVQRELKELHEKLHGTEAAAGFGGRLV